LAALKRIIRSRWAWGGSLLLLAGCGLSATPLDQAREHYRRGEWDRAVAACDQQLRTSPDSVEAMLLRGRARLAGGQYGAAAADFSHVIRLDPTNPEGFYQRSLAHAALGNADQADEDRRHARDIDTQDAALVRRHTSSLKGVEPVRIEPPKETESDEAVRPTWAVDLERDDPLQLSFDLASRPTNQRSAEKQAADESPAEQGLAEDSLTHSRLLAPRSASEPPAAEATSIVGGTSLLESPILESPLFPLSPRKKTSPKSPQAPLPEEAPDIEKPKPPQPPPHAAQPQTEQSPLAWRSLVPGLQHDPTAAPGGSHAPGRQPEESNQIAQPRGRQSKYPIAQLNFMSPLAQPHGLPVQSPAGPVPAAPQKPSLMPPPLKPTSLMPESTLVRLGLVRPPEELAEAAPQVPPGFLAIQVRGFTPDAPPWPLSMPSEPRRRRSFELPATPATPEPDRTELVTTTTERSMPAPKKGPAPPKLPFDE
jgi:hypothetical protein